jgi:hypothetical protein
MLLLVSMLHSMLQAASPGAFQPWVSPLCSRLTSTPDQAAAAAADTFSIYLQDATAGCAASKHASSVMVPALQGQAQNSPDALRVTQLWMMFLVRGMCIDGPTKPPYR